MCNIWFYNKIDDKYWNEMNYEINILLKCINNVFKIITHITNFRCFFFIWKKNNTQK